MSLTNVFPFARGKAPRRPFTGDAGPLLARLWHGWARPHLPSLALVALAIIVVAVATSLYPVVIKAAFDAFEARDKRVVQLIPVFVIAVTALKGFAMLAQARLTNRVVTRIEADIQGDLYAHLIRADVARLARETPAALTQRFTTDFAFIREALTRLSTVFLRDVATALAVFGVMFWIDWQITLAAIVVLPFVLPPIARIGKRLRRVAVSTQEQTGLMASLVAESLAGIRVAKTYGLEGYLEGRARAAFDEVRALKMKTANQRARLDPLLEIGGGVAVAVVLVFIGWRIIHGDSTVGDFTGFVTALLLAAQSMRSLGNLNAIVQEALASLDRVFKVLDERATIAERVDARPLDVTRGEVAFEAVSFRYRDDVPALRDVSFTAPGGRVTALVGRSGAGKSTLLNLVPRLIDPDAGAVLVDGTDIREASLASLRAAISVVSQDVVLFDDTIAANIGFGRPDAAEDEIVAAARAAAAHDFITRLPEGYCARVGDRGARLSGGERQRIALARAILKDAPILILDEATSALDSESERAVQDALARLMRGRTSIVIAHRLSTVRAADRIVVLDAGEVVETGSHDELIARGGLYARLHRLQSDPEIFGLTRA